MNQIQPYKILFGSESNKVLLAGLKLQCYILEGGKHVISLDSIQKAMGYNGKSKNWLFEFLMHINRLTLIEPALLEALAKKIAFEAESSVIGEIKYGIEAKLLLQACKGVLKAKEEGFLYLSELKFAKAAENLIENIGDAAAFGKLIDFASGFDLYKHNHKEALLRHLQKNAGQKSAVWLRSFPDPFFETIFRFRNWEWRDLNTNAEVVGSFINDAVFSRLDPKLLEELGDTKPKMKYRKKNNPEEYLEHPLLKGHLLEVTALISASGKSQLIFEQLLNRTLPRKNDLKLSVLIKTEIDRTSDEKIADFNETLKKAFTQKGSNKIR